MHFRTMTRARQALLVWGAALLAVFVLVQLVGGWVIDSVAVPTFTKTTSLRVNIAVRGNGDATWNLYLPENGGEAAASGTGRLDGSSLEIKLPGDARFPGRVPYATGRIATEPPWWYRTLDVMVLTHDAPVYNGSIPGQPGEPLPLVADVDQLDSTLRLQFSTGGQPVAKGASFTASVLMLPPEQVARLEKQKRDAIAAG